MAKFSTPNLPSNFVLHESVAQALRDRQPIVALESAVITHGLPRPENLNLARKMEAEVRAAGAVPATTALLDGKVHVGISSEELERLANADGTRKISLRDFGVAVARGESGGTTVAATLHIAHAAGIQVFATGGIGGVHRGAAFDVSADLPMLGRTPVVVVCAGAKAILDLPNTLEYLETVGVPILGYQTNTFPAFYSISSGLPVTVRVDSPAEAARTARAHWTAGLTSAVLVTVPPPAEDALPREAVEAEVQQALREAEQQHVSGFAVTPFLLSRMSELSGGGSLHVNLALLLQNGRVAAQIAVELAEGKNLHM